MRRDQLVAGRRLDQHPRPGAAHVALIDEYPGHDPAGRRLDVSVRADDVHRGAAELERQRLARQRAGLGYFLADLGRSGERHLVKPRMARHQLAGAAVAGHHVDHPGRQVGLPADLGERERGQRRRLRGLQDDGVPAGEGGRDLPRQHQQGRTPGDDLADHAERPRAPARTRRTPACRPSRRGRRNARAASGTSTSRICLIGLPPSSVSRKASSPARSLISRAIVNRYLDLRPPRHCRPDPLVGLPGGQHRPVHVLGRPVRHLGQNFLGGGRDRLEHRCPGRERAPDEQPVGVTQRRKRARLLGCSVLKPHCSNPLSSPPSGSGRA